MATQLRLLIFTVLFALAATACSSNAEVQTATEDSAPPALAIADEQESQAPAAQLGVGSETQQLLTDIEIETDWTKSDLADARATLDAWRAVWDAHGGFAYTLTVGDEGGEQVALLFDADGSLEQELVVSGDETTLEATRRLRSVDEVFDHISWVIDLFEDGTMNRDEGPFYDVSFDPDFGVPSRFVGGDDASYPTPRIAKVERR